MQKFFPALSLAVFVAVWQMIALVLNSSLLPSPMVVLGVFWLELVSGQLTYHLGATLIRLIISFTVAMLLGSAIGLALGRRKNLDAFFDNWLVIFLNIPALVTIILCYVWFGLTETSAILAVIINKLPNVIVTVREGARTLDQDLLDMARSYRLNRLTTLRHVIWPQLHPFLMSATRSGLALIWKIILIVELLGRNNGVGFQLHLYFQLFDVASILAYSIAFVIVIQGIEQMILKPLDKKSQRWRR